MNDNATMTVVVLIVVGFLAVLVLTCAAIDKQKSDNKKECVIGMSSSGKYTSMEIEKVCDQ